MYDVKARLQELQWKDDPEMPIYDVGIVRTLSDRICLISKSLIMVLICLDVSIFFHASFFK